MKYKYFVSYFSPVNSGFGVGRCEVTLTRKIDCIDDIEYMEKEILKYNKEVNKLTIINYQLMKTIKRKMNF